MPGTGLVIAGFFLLLKAMNISFLKGMRTSKFWLNAEGFIKILGGIVGILFEYGDMVTTHKYSQSHYDHLEILGLIVILGVLDIAHLHNVLRDPIWMMTSPVGWAYIGIKFNAHEQETYVRVTAHYINTVVLILAGCSRALENFINLHTNKKYHVAVLKKEMLEKETKKSSPTCTVWNFCSFLSVRGCCKTNAPSDGVIIGYNSIYTNQQVYATIFPMLTAMLIMFDGIWWWEMGVSLFRGPPNPAMENGHMGMEMIYQMFGRDLMILIVTTAFISFILHQIDQRFFANEYNSLQLKMADNLGNVEFEFDSNFELEKFSIE